MLNYTIAIVIPCHNEEKAIGKTISEFKKQLPQAKVVICDNASTDRTAEVATEHGAIVLFEPKQGKGNAVAKLFRDVQADIYVLVDGDCTYDPPSAQKMVQCLIAENLDMVVGKRKDIGEKLTYRAGHRTGNQIFNLLLKYIYGSTFTDIFSGYRVFSNRFVKSFPLTSRGFEIEMELSVFSLDLGISFKEIDTPYRSRPEGSVSKLNKYRDGYRILKKITSLFVEFKPIQFFGTVGFVMLTGAIALFIPIFISYFETGLVPRFPTLIVSVSLALTAALSIMTAIILNEVSKFRLENRRIQFLRLPALREMNGAHRST